MPPLEDMATSAAGPGDHILQQSINFLGLPAYIISSFFPGILQVIKRYPKLVKALSLPIITYWIISFSAAKISTLLQYLMSYFMSSITITAADAQLLASFLRFIGTKKLFLPNRDMTAYTTTHVQKQADYYGLHHNKDFGKGQPIGFESSTEFQIFRHNSRFFFMTCKAPATPSSRQVAGASWNNDYRLYCPGWSPAPIKNLVLEAYNTFHQSEQKVITNIYAPDGGAAWELRCSRTRRPLNSVYLDHAQKAGIIEDIKDFLAPSTARWYARRGIPYRRGFLFYGQPGTGKTSLAVALAGHFKLDVHILSLLDPGIKDTSLQFLFQQLRPGDIILLEDVDSAGLHREDAGGTDDIDMVASVEDMGAIDDLNAEQMKEILKKQQQKPKEQARLSKVTLSALLNVIDGATAPQGTILILTTNRPENLDDALVRAGRVDVRVKFEYASKSQIRDIFVNMYRPQRKKGWRTDEDAKEGYRKELGELKVLAREFARKVPTRKVSPAMLQDYILTKKTSPRKAVDEVEKWLVDEQGVGMEGLELEEAGGEEAGECSDGEEEEDEETDDDEDDEDGGFVAGDEHSGWGEQLWS